MSSTDKKIARLQRLIKNTTEDIVEMEELEDEEEKEELEELQAELKKYKADLKELLSGKKDADGPKVDEGKHGGVSYEVETRDYKKTDTYIDEVKGQIDTKAKKEALLSHQKEIKKTDTYIDEVKGQIDTKAKKEALLSHQKKIKKTDTYIDEVKGSMDHGSVKKNYEASLKGGKIKKTDTYIDEVKGQIDHSSIKKSYEKNTKGGKKIKKTDTYIDEVKGQIDTKAKKEALFAKKKDFKKTKVDQKGNAKKFAALFEAGGQSDKKKKKTTDSYFANSGSGPDSKSLRSKFEFLAKAETPSGPSKPTKSRRNKYSQTQGRNSGSAPRKSVFSAFEAEDTGSKTTKKTTQERVVKPEKKIAPTPAAPAVSVEVTPGLSDRSLNRKIKKAKEDLSFSKSQIEKYTEFIKDLESRKSTLEAKIAGYEEDEKSYAAKIASGGSADAGAAPAADVSFKGKVILLPGGFAVDKDSYSLGDKYKGNVVTAVVIPQNA